MNTPEMHVMFRQYAQQMGMQNVRAILPEQIDLLLNTSQMDIVNQIIKENIGITNDRVITDNSKVGQINALRSLYHVAIIEMSPMALQLEESRAFVFNAADVNTGRMTTNFTKISEVNLIPEYMFLVDFSLNYKKVINKRGYNGKNEVIKKNSYGILTPDACVNGYKAYISTKNNLEYLSTVETFVDLNSFEGYKLLDYKVDNSDTNNLRLKCTNIEYKDYYLGVEGKNELDSQYGGMHYVLTKTFTDGDSNYNKGVIYNPLVIEDSHLISSYVRPQFDSDSIETNFFPVRLIDDSYLADTLNDFVLKPRLRSPIIVTYNNNKNNIFDIYIDKFHKVLVSENNYRYVLDYDLIPYQLRMSYISKPNRIEYKEDMGEPSINSDLPEYMHVDIVKHAVDLYRIAISNSLMAAQNQEQAAKQENMRNNYRNEGNVQ